MVRQVKTEMLNSKQSPKAVSLVAKRQLKKSQPAADSQLRRERLREKRRKKRSPISAESVANSAPKITFFRLFSRSSSSKNNNLERFSNNSKNRETTNSSVRSRPTGNTAKTAKNRRPPQKSSPLVYLLRLVIIGVGIGAIAGTILSVFDPAHSPFAGAKQTQAKKQEKTNTTTVQSVASLALGQPIAPLKQTIQTLVAEYPNLQAQAFFIDLDNNSYLDVEGAKVIAAASTIKVPILVAFFQDVDAGKIRLDEMLTMTSDSVATGSGDMQYQSVNSQFTALATITKMIAISDNTATNMIINRLGGAEALNKRFQSWGLSTTAIRNPLPDLEGTNTTSPKDLGMLMGMINQGELVSMKSRDRILDIMRQTVTRTLLPQGLGEGATIAHKTGDIGTMIGDVGLIDMPNGKRYIGVVMVTRPHNDPQGRELIQKISRNVYDYLNQPPNPPASTTTPANPSASPTSTTPPKITETGKEKLNIIAQQ